jgi:hypothetical protein
MLATLGSWTECQAIGAAVYQSCELKSRRGKNINLSAYRSNSNIVGLIFRRTIYMYIRLKIKPNSVIIRF